MIQVDQKETIRRLYFINRHSVRQIAKELGHSRKTVRKAIADASVPRYHQSAARASPVVGPHINTIKSWLEADKDCPPKQQHKAGGSPFTTSADKGAADNLCPNEKQASENGSLHIVRCSIVTGD